MIFKMGPLTTPRGIDKALSHVEDAKKNGAKVLFGGQKIKIDDGYFFEPTVIVNAHKDLLIAQEETFAPIAAFFKFNSEEEAVEAANKTSVSPMCCMDTKANQRRWALLRTSSQRTSTGHGGYWRILRLE